MCLSTERKLMCLSNKLEYFKVIKNIYTKILSKMNSSVSKTFINAFQLIDRGKDAPIFENEIKDFIVKNLNINITKIEQKSR